MCFSFQKSFSRGMKLRRHAWRTDHMHGRSDSAHAHTHPPELYRNASFPVHYPGTSREWDELRQSPAHATKKCIYQWCNYACVVNYAQASNHHLHATSPRHSARQDAFPDKPCMITCHAHTHTIIFEQIWTSSLFIWTMLLSFFEINCFTFIDSVLNKS